VNKIINKQEKGDISLEARTRIWLDGVTPTFLDYLLSKSGLKFYREADS